MSQWIELEKRFDALQPRERVLMSVVVGVLLVFFLYLLWIEPAGKAAAASQMQIDSLEPQVDGVRIALERVEQELARDPEAERRVALDSLRAEAASIDDRLRADEARVIAPATMRAMRFI
jgi:MSHA biogenesis protein MshJ